MAIATTVWSAVILLLALAVASAVIGEPTDRLTEMGVSEAQAVGLVMVGATLEFLRNAAAVTFLYAAVVLPLIAWAKCEE